MSRNSGKRCTVSLPETTDALPHNLCVFYVCVCVCVDVEFYRLWLGRYRLQHVRAKDCPSAKDLGLMLVDTAELRNQLLPSPIRCLEVHIIILYHLLFTSLFSSGNT